MDSEPAYLWIQAWNAVEAAQEELQDQFKIAKTKLGFTRNIGQFCLLLSMPERSITLNELWRRRLCPGNPRYAVESLIKGRYLVSEKINGADQRTRSIMLTKKGREMRKAFAAYAKARTDTVLAQSLREVAATANIAKHAFRL